MGMISEFKEFALKGNMVDMAVGIVMGGAIGTLVGSMVENLINPIVGKFTGGVDLGSLQASIGERTVTNEEGVDVIEQLMLNYGAFVTSFINFLILAFVIFLIVKTVNNAKKAMGLDKPGAPAGPSEVDLLTEIRDSLQK